MVYIRPDISAVGPRAQHKPFANDIPALLDQRFPSGCTHHPSIQRGYPHESTSPELKGFRTDNEKKPATGKNMLSLDQSRTKVSIFFSPLSESRCCSGDRKICTTGFHLSFQNRNILILNTLNIQLTSLIICYLVKPHGFVM